MTLLLEQIRTFTTIMSIQQELYIISCISQFNDSDLLSELETLSCILDILYESHTGGTLFEVNEDNRSILHEFASRVYNLADKTCSNKDSDMLKSFASAIDTIFPAM